MALSVTLLFEPLQLPSSVGVIWSGFSSPATAVLKNGMVRLTNTTGGIVSATLYVGPGSGAVAADCFLSAVPISANASIDVPLPTMKPGFTFRGFASAANSITIHESGGYIHA